MLFLCWVYSFSSPNFDGKPCTDPERTEEASCAHTSLCLGQRVTESCPLFQSLRMTAQVHKPRTQESWAAPLPSTSPPAGKGKYFPLLQLEVSLLLPCYVTAAPPPKGTEIWSKFPLEDEEPFLNLRLQTDLGSVLGPLCDRSLLGNTSEKLAERNKEGNARQRALSGLQRKGG